MDILLRIYLSSLELLKRVHLQLKTIWRLCSL